MLQSIDDVALVYEYLYMQNRRENITEITFALKDYSTFSSEDRKKIRTVFKKSIYVAFLFKKKILSKFLISRGGEVYFIEY